MKKLKLDYTTFSQLLDTVENVESFTAGEIASIKKAFNDALNQKDMSTAQYALETLLAAIEGAKEGV